jgi:serine/threonine protein kinase
MVFLQIYIYIYIVDVLGTYVYMAPEVIRCEPYTEKCDVYSFY